MTLVVGFLIGLLALFLIGLLIHLLVRSKREIGKTQSAKKRLFVKNIELETTISLLRQSYEKDRELMARALHDEVGGNLASLKLMLNAFSRNMHGDEFAFVVRMEKQVETLINSIRVLSKNAYPASLRQFGLGIAIQELCERATNPKITRVHYSENEPGQRLMLDRELIIYRAVQELINNAVRHSFAWHIYVNLQWFENQLIITVEDDGVGWGSWKKSKGGIGLDSIRGSLRTINTKITLDRDGKGVKAVISHPIYNGSYQSLHSG